MSSELCQIMTYGGEDQWIRLGLREYPKTQRIILVTSSERRIHQNGHTAKKDSKRRGGIDYFKQAKKLLNDFEKEEKDLPEDKKRKYHLLSPPDTRDHNELIRFFRELFLHIIKNDGKIIINTTSGLQVWKLALYQIAMEFREDIEDFYLIQKSNGEIRRIRIYRPLKEYEKNIIQIISEKPEIVISDVQKRFHKEYGKGNLTFISRTVRNLIQEKLIKEEKIGREVKLQLTNEGRSFVPSRDYDFILSPLFKGTR